MSEDDEAVEGYASHGDRMSWVLEAAIARRAHIAKKLREAFAAFVETRATEWIVFEHITAEELARVLLNHPSIVKPLTAICNVAHRAIQRDLGFKVDTYNPRLTEAQAYQLAGYLKPFLPAALALPALEAIDEWFYIDKEIRAFQGRWERHTSEALSRRTGRPFRKRKFAVTGEDGDSQVFELDAATPVVGEPIEVGVDVKRIGAHLDIHKRVDEIGRKADKFKAAYPGGKFGAVIYFPFNTAEQANITNRLRGPNVDGIVYAGDSKESVERAVLLLIPQLGLEVIDDTPPSSLFDELHNRRDG